MTSQDHVEATPSSRAIGRWGRVVIAAFSTGFLALNAGISLLILHHASPMLIYPAFNAFLTVHFLINKRMPSHLAISLFCIACESVVLLPLIHLAVANRAHEIAFWSVVEPACFLPAIGAYLALTKRSAPIKAAARAYLGIGGVFVAASFIAMLPGNPVLGLLDGPLGASFPSGGAGIPVSVLRDLFLYYHLPVVLGSFGSAAFLLGIVVLHTETRLSDFDFFAVIIAVVFSLYGVGVAIAWHVLKGQASMAGARPNPPGDPA